MADLQSEAWVGQITVEMHSGAMPRCELGDGTWAIISISKMMFTRVCVCVCHTGPQLEKWSSCVFTCTRLGTRNASEHIGCASLSSAGYCSTIGGLLCVKEVKIHTHTHTNEGINTNKDVWVDTQLSDCMQISKCPVHLRHRQLQVSHSVDAIEIHITYISWYCLYIPWHLNSSHLSSPVLKLC